MHGEAEMCDRCLDVAIHVRCLTREEKEDLDGLDYWMCPPCDRIIMEVINRDYDSESES